MASIRAVSQLAGVSVATVSRAFSDPAKVSAKTLDAVRKAAEQLNYKPNSMARQFRSKRTNSVVVIVPDLANAFFARVLAGIESVAARHGLSVLLVDSHDDAEIERGCLDMVWTRRTDGVIQLGAHSLETLARRAATRDIPFVHAIEPPDTPSCPSVCIDNVAASAAITDFVIGQGHRRIGVVAGREDSEITSRRLAGYRKALNRAEIAFDETAVVYGPYSVQGGEQAAQRLLARHGNLTALVCMSDEIALGAMKAARAAGRSLPSQLSITGFDNITVGEYVHPALTTVTQPSWDIGRAAMELMVQLLSGRAPADAHVTLETQLVIRDSVVPPGPGPD